MSNISLQGDNKWTAASIYDETQGNSQAEINAGIAALETATLELAGDIDNINEELKYEKKPFTATADGWRLLSTGLASNNNSYRLIKYAVTPGDTIMIKSAAPPSGGASYQFQTSASVSASSNPYIVGDPVLTKTNASVTVPATATYLILSALKTDNNVGIYSYTKFDEINSDLEKLDEKTNLLADVDNVIVMGENYEFTAVSSSTWQSGYQLNQDFALTGSEETLTIVADSANGYGGQLITVIFYADAAKTTQLLRKDIDWSFNSNPYRQYNIPTGSAVVNIKVCLISNSFGTHVPSAGDLAYIHGLLIYYDAFALDPNIILPQMERLDPSAIYVLPDAWKEKIQPIQTAQGEKFCFAVQTDTHFGDVGTDVPADTYPDLMNDLSKLTEYVGFDFICNLGDLTRGYTADTTEKMLEAFTELMHRYVTNLRCPLFVIPGNHDTNAMYAEAQSDPGLQITKADMFAKLIPFVKNSAPGIVLNGRSLYYYMDFDDADIRCIFLNTTDGDYSGSTIGSTFVISSEQVTWFANVALNTTKKIMVFAHVPLVSGLSANSVTNADGIMSALYAFSGTVIGCFYGHTHAQNSKVDDHGILHVTFTRGGACAEIVMVGSGAINTIGIGKDTGGHAVQNRTFSYGS